ncbi:hypothetical protein O6H91_17G073100 [Diphasiastrum complanatum]|uniref:Uncharacterized protein n=1 Tax=Diphasiastrum complanatum TaxID=34168 RepID=A0ACC2B820_DIPCM|nr:hypothetical protein O6H91_17G073100 [Diphasiastrum complanatum]
MGDPASTTLTIVSSQSITENERNSDTSKTSTNNQQDLQPRPSNAAAWAWYQHAGGAAAAAGGGISATFCSASPHVAVRRASRFREEAMRRSCSRDDLVFKVESEIVGASSLFDTYELASVAKQLDRALSGNSFTTNLNSPRHRSSLKATRRLRIRVPPVLCSSTKVVAIKDQTKRLDHHARSGHLTTIHLGKLSKAFQLFSLETKSEYNSEYQR